MTCVLDTTALVALLVDCPARRVAAGALDNAVLAADGVCASALALVEARAVLSRLADDPVTVCDLDDALRRLWDHCAVVPVDQRCLDRAAELMAARPLRLADAVHLAAADRLPRPVTFVTFDAAQIPVALAMGFDVVSS